MAKRIYGMDNLLIGGCGVSYINDFDTERYGGSEWWADEGNKSIRSIKGGGAGWLTAAFVNTPVCKTAYEILTDKHGPPVYQTPVRLNRNSQRDFFFAIWDTR